jgi:hypothetical protein
MGQQISKGIELAKSKGGSHFAITEISSKKGTSFVCCVCVCVCVCLSLTFPCVVLNVAGGAAQQTEEELNKILMHILKELPNLNRITVTSCNLTLLPDEELGKVINLVTLSLEENMLTQLNEGFRNLFNLKELYLSKNYFTRLPAELGYLASLELLSLNHNYLGVRCIPWWAYACTRMHVLSSLRVLTRFDGVAVCTPQGTAPPRSAGLTSSGMTMSPSKDSNKGSNKLDTWRKSWRNRKGGKKTKSTSSSSSASAPVFSSCPLLTSDPRLRVGRSRGRDGGRLLPDGQ